MEAEKRELAMSPSDANERFSCKRLSLEMAALLRFGSGFV
jgi:hypothetical protein